MKCRRHGVHEGVDDSTDGGRIVVDREADSFSDLLLMYPVFGEVTGTVQPDRRRIRPGPADRLAEPASSAEFQCAKICSDVMVSSFVRALALIHCGMDPLRVVAVKESRKRLSLERVAGRMGIARTRSRP